MLPNKVCLRAFAQSKATANQPLKAAFEDFLTNYKSTATVSDQLAADALQNLNLDEDGLSDDYDFMDDVANDKEPRQRGRQFAEPKKKYMDILQKVADRQTNEVMIELDDLDNVGISAVKPCSNEYAANLVRPVRKRLRRGHGIATGGFHRA